ncbi:proliferation marker protein Ki-67 isoform X2 [Amia ocellicauda]|uniref:proliferation marker protein Ki-67 isoform X2 n=1 Tax=Amia ocellicauda TaxID=2972642 RepID=UPI0034648FA2
MPLHGKIVVIKRSGADGTEFPLTAASCLFGRKPDCDIRIQLPHVSKEHCRVEVNENKEVIITNLSSVNPTRLNGQVIEQAGRLKHGDLITIIDRSFRFEYPPEPTPKKTRPSGAAKSETLQQVKDASHLSSGNRRKSAQLMSDSSYDLKEAKDTGNEQVHKDPDGGETKSGGKEAFGTGPEPVQSNENKDPFGELYEMVKHNFKASDKREKLASNAAARSPWPTSGSPDAKTPRREPEMIIRTPVPEKHVLADKDELNRESNAQFTPSNKKTPVKNESATVSETSAAEAKVTGQTPKGTPKPTRRSKKPIEENLDTDVSDETQLKTCDVPTLPLEQTSSPLTASGAPGAEESPRRGQRSSQALAEVAKTPSAPVSEKKARLVTPCRLSAEEVVRELLSESDMAVEESVKTDATSKGGRRRRSRSRGSFTEVAVVEEPVVSPRRTSRSLSPGAGTPKGNGSEESAKIVKSSPKVKQSPKQSPRASPRNLSGKAQETGSPAPPSGTKAAVNTEKPKKRRSGELAEKLAEPPLKRKRVSFGGHLSPELFDKRLPPDSPLRKGATPFRMRRALGSKTAAGRRATIGITCSLMEELSPKKKASPRRSSTSPPKKLGAKTPSPAKSASPGRKSPSGTSKSPSPAGRKSKSPSKEDPTTPRGRKSGTTPAKTPSPVRSPAKTPSPGRRSLSSAVMPSPALSVAATPHGRRSGFGDASPVKSVRSTPAAKTPSPIEAVASPSHGRRSSPAAAKKTPSLAVRSPGRKSLAGGSNTPLSSGASPSRSVKTPSSGRKSAASSPGQVQTPVVRGRFSVSRISTPSPVADEKGDLAEVPAPAVTSKAALRRKSMKSTSKKTPSISRRKSAMLDVVRSRRSGASQANLVVRSWADIVKQGALKSQAGVPGKKRTMKGKTVKKAAPVPQTPAQRVKQHFSTGHAASPATIVIGRAHSKAVLPAGRAPRLVHNVAVLRKNLEINENLTGIAEMFSTPVNERQRRNRQSSDYSGAEAAQDVVYSPLTEASVMNTPEETGEMVVSPLSVTSTAKQGRYNKDAVSRLLQERTSSFDTVGTPLVKSSTVRRASAGDSVTPKEKVQAVKMVSLEAEEPARPTRLSTPRQKAEPPLPLTGVKRIMTTPKQKTQQLEDLRGLKRLLKTPRGPKLVVEESLVGVKGLVKTPKTKGHPVEDMVGVKRVMRTPKTKGQPVEDHFGISRLVKSPKQRGGPVEDFTGLEELWQEPLQKLDTSKTEPESKVSEKVLSPKRGKTSGSFTEMTVENKVSSPKRVAQPTETQNEAETLLSSVQKPGRGRKAKESAEASTEPRTAVPALKRPRRGRITDLSEETPASVTKSARGRKVTQKQVSFEAAEVALMTPAVRRTRRDTKSNELDSTASPAPTVSSTRGHKAKIGAEPTIQVVVEAADPIPQNVTASPAVKTPSPVETPAAELEEVPAPVKRPGRGRKAKPVPKEEGALGTETAAEESVSESGRKLSTLKRVSAIDVQATASPAPAKKMRRGRNARPIEGLGPVASEAERSVAETVGVKSVSPVPVRTARGRKARVEVEEVEQTKASKSLPQRSARGGAKGATPQIFASPAPAKLPGRGRKAAEKVEKILPSTAESVRDLPTSKRARKVVISKEMSSTPARTVRGKSSATPSLESAPPARKGRGPGPKTAQPTADLRAEAVPAAVKRGTKRRATCEEVVQAILEDPSSSEASSAVAPKRPRGRTARAPAADLPKERDNAAKAAAETSKKGPRLRRRDGETAETSEEQPREESKPRPTEVSPKKPVGRPKRKTAPEPEVPAAVPKTPRGRRVAKAAVEPKADEVKAENATRARRGETKKQTEGITAAEAKPVRSTRRR